MEKIIKYAISKRIPDIGLKDDMAISILDIIYATPNPEIATEIFLGVYVKPVIPATPVSCESTYFSNKENVKFIRYDKFNNRVYFSFNSQIIEKAWQSKIDGSVIITKTHSENTSFNLIVKKLKDDGKDVNNVSIKDYNPVIFITGINENTDIKSVSLDKWLDKTPSYMKSNNNMKSIKSE